MKRVAVTLIALAALAAAAPPAVGGRIKLVSVPERASVVLRLDHPDDVLVQEERSVTLQRGVNRLDFSWKRVGIEPGSIQLEPLDQAGRVQVLNVSFPPEESALVWEVDSQVAGPVRMRLTYLLKGLRRIVSYRVVTNADETAIELRGYLTLQNYSGESFDEVAIEPGYGARFVKKLADGESKQMLSFAAQGVPVTKQLVYDPDRYGERVVIRYKLENTTQNKLGEFALPAGKVRLFESQPKTGAAFVGEDFAEFTPVGGKMDLLLGDARDLSVKRTVAEIKKIARLREQDGHIRLYDSDETYRYELQNFGETPAPLTVVAHVDDTWRLVQSSHPFERKDSRTIEFTVELPAKGEKIILEYQVLRTNLE
jgi:hypothetical protein